MKMFAIAAIIMIILTFAFDVICLIKTEWFTKNLERRLKIIGICSNAITLAIIDFWVMKNLAGHAGSVWLIDFQYFCFAFLFIFFLCFLLVSSFMPKKA